MNILTAVIVTVIIVSPLSILLWKAYDDRKRLKRKKKKLENLKKTSNALHERMETFEESDLTEIEQKILKLAYKTLLNAQEYLEEAQDQVTNYRKPSPGLNTLIILTSTRLAKARALTTIVHKKSLR